MWTGHDTLLLVYALLAVALIVVLIACLKMHAFLALMIGALFVGLTDAGFWLVKEIESVQEGVGTTLANVGIVLALGTMLGKLLADSGGADQIATTVLSRSGERRLPWAMALIATIVGIPLFLEIGVVLLIPIIFTVTRRLEVSQQAALREGPGTTVAYPARAASAYLLVGIPALAGLSVLHGLVPPHPGPLVAIGALDADLGRTLLIGLVLAISTVIIAGPLFGMYISRRVSTRPPQELLDQVAGHARDDDIERVNPPGSRSCCSPFCCQWR